MKRVSPPSLIWLITVLALGTSACGEEEPATAKKIIPETPQCEFDPFSPSETTIETQNTLQNGENASAIIYGVSGSPEKFDQLTFETWKVSSQDGSSNWVGPITPGTYKIEDIATGDGGPMDYLTCSLCVTYRRSCAMQQASASCQESLIATKGTVVIESIGFAHGQEISVKMSDLVFVPFDSSDGSLVEGGEESCMASAGLSKAFDDGKTRVTPYASPDTSCVTAGNGNGIGNNIADVTFKKCDGTTVTLHELGCSATDKAIWLATSAQWCGPCKLLDPIYYGLAQENEAIDFYVVLGQRDQTQTTMNTEEMMLQVCQNGFGNPGADWTSVPPSNILMDSEWVKSDIAMNNYDNFLIPYSRILRGTNMEYLWTPYAIRQDGTLPTEKTALQEASGLDTIVGWEEMLTRIEQSVNGN